MKKILLAALTMSVMLFAANSAIADLYKWVDENGVTHFSDVRPPDEQQAVTIKTPKNKPITQKPASVKTQVTVNPYARTNSRKAVGGNKPEKQNSPSLVKIFTTSWCKYCKQAIAFLNSNHIEFQQFDIEKERGAAAMMYSFGGTGGVPFALIKGQKVYGYSAETYKKALGLH